MLPIRATHEKVTIGPRHRYTTSLAPFSGIDATAKEDGAVVLHHWDYHGPMSNSPPSAISAIEVPAVGQLLGFADLKIRTTECSADINLLTQVAPLIASMSCQLKILKLLKPLIELIKGLPNPPVQALLEFSEAAETLAPCLLVPTPSSVVPFLQGLLCLEIRSLKCFLRNLQAITTLAGTDPSGVAVLEVRSVLDSYAPIVGILGLASELFQLVRLNVPKAPILTGRIDPDSLNVDRTRVATFTTDLETMADALGGCE